MVIVTCISVGVYRHHFVRGEQYEVHAQNEEKRQVRVRSRLGRLAWFPRYLFDFENHPQAVLTTWQFNDPVYEPSVHIKTEWTDEWTEERNETYNAVEVAFQLSDGTTRWCLFITPDYLKCMVTPPDSQTYVPEGDNMAVWATHMVFIHDLREKTVDTVLRYMNEQNELISHSLQYEPSALDDDEEKYIESDFPSAEG